MAKSKIAKGTPGRKVTDTSPRSEYQRMVDKVNARIRSYQKEGLVDNAFMKEMRQLQKHHKNAIKIDDQGRIRVSQAKKYESELKGKLGQMTRYKSYDKGIARKSQEKADKARQDFMRKYKLNEREAELLQQLCENWSVIKYLSAENGWTISETINELRSWTASSVFEPTIYNQLRSLNDSEVDRILDELIDINDEWASMIPDDDEPFFISE